jgi:hypothetical protein
MNPLKWGATGVSEQFEAVGLSTFDDFWNIEDKSDKLEILPKRKHVASSSNEILRQTIRILLNGRNYFLKRTSGKSYSCIKTEYRALSIIPQFDLVAPHVKVYSFDDENRRGFILLHDMEGFYCLRAIHKNEISAKAAEKIGDVRRFYSPILAIFEKFQKSDYFYCDWMDKHIFINPDTSQIGLIDLERFVHKSAAPFHWRLPFIYRRKRDKERGKLLGALRMKS